ncbi:MAG: PD-(D/E)XK nuclease domain-containing protein, partial [Elusimicrobiota bacterium]|nr:PD-(D/E)XK nuclease domain-containing protein [Elusimicrobiota bacterium]
EQINDSDAKGLEQNLKTIFAKIPYTLHIGRESYYHSILLVLMDLLKFDIRAEQLTDKGRIDAVWKQENSTIIIEVKFSKKKSKKALLAEAMNQIKDKKYYEAYLDKPVTLLAIAFAAGKNKKRLTEIGCKFEKI